MSRQSKWQAEQVATGNCRLCGKKRKRYATLCDACRKKENARKRRRRKLLKKDPK